MNEDTTAQKSSKKDIFLKIRISKKETSILQKQADKGKMTLSDYIRQATLDYHLRKSPQDKKVLRDKTRLASNINQIARQVNTYKDDIDKLQLLTCLLEIENKIHEGALECI